MQTWLNTVNTKIYEPYDVKEEIPLIENNTDIGAPARRRRTTKKIITHTFTMKFSKAEWGLIRGWIDTTLSGGVLTFGFPHPDTSTLTEMRFLFSDNQWYTGFTNYSDFVLVQVSMQEV